MAEDTGTASPLRTELGDFSSIICFRALVIGIEEALGRRAAAVALKAAGRKRGASLVHSLGLAASHPAPEDATHALAKALGVDGTRLCIINRVEKNGDTFRVLTSETICSADEPAGSDRECTYTLGAIHGAVETLYGTKLRCKQVESVLRGGSYDAFELDPR